MPENLRRANLLLNMYFDAAIDGLCQEDLTFIQIAFGRTVSQNLG